MARTIKRYSLRQKYGQQTFFTVDSNADFAQIVDMRILINTAYTTDTINIGFGLWAVDADGNTVAKFFPNSYTIDNVGTQSICCFDTYIQLPAGCTIMTNITYPGTADGNVELSATIEEYN